MSENNNSQPVATVQIVSKPGGWRTALTFIATLFIIGFSFFIGVGTGSAAKGLGGVIAPYETVLKRNGSSSTIALLEVSGMIDDAQASWFQAAAEDIAKDNSIKAVVLRVNSGGGGVTASDQMWRSVEKIKKAGKPIVGSFGAIAASGGYYIATSCDQIIVEPTTITGSIGVIAQIMTVENLLESIGVKPVTLVASGSPEKDVANDIFRSWKSADKKKVMTMLDHSYNIFKQRVVNGRGVRIKKKNLDAACSGSIFMAPKAVSLGLVDGTGYLDDAIQIAESLADVGKRKPKIDLYRPATNPLQEMLSVNSKFSTFSSDALRKFASELAMPRPMYLVH